MVTDYEQLRAMADESSFVTGEDGGSANTPRSRTLSEVSRDLIRGVVSGETGLTRMELTIRVFFFLGGCFFSWIAIWDLPTSPLEADDDDQSSGDDLVDILVYTDLYNLILCLGPTFFLLGGLLEVRDAYKEAIDEGYRGCNIFGGESNHQLELSIGITMIVASLFDLLSVVTEILGGVKDPSSLAAHFYLINAIVALWKGRPESWWGPRTMGQLGDWLFLIGCLIDCVISYLPDPELTDDDTANDHLLPTWKRDLILGVVSSGLWWLDSILYLLADLCTALYDDEDSEDSSDASDDDFSLESNSMAEDLSRPLLQHR